MRIAVIGGGIAGNVAAYHLCKEHEVTLFEAADRLGGHTHTHDIEWAGHHYAVDTGFIVFNDRTYPLFLQLLGELGVAFEPTEMSFSVRDDRADLEYNGHSLNTLFAQRRNLFRRDFLHMLKEILRFNREAPRSLEDGSADLPLGDYLQKQRYSKHFIDRYILPMGAAIWSTDQLQMQQFPARFFIRFFVNHGLLSLNDRPQWYVIRGGSREYLAPMSAPYASGIRLNTPVQSIARLAHGVRVVSRAHGSEVFDAVFIATHSDQALAMLSDPTRAEREVLGRLRYQRNEAILHTDTLVMPRRHLAWASWNYRLDGRRDKVTLTYDMNRLQNLDAPARFLVTLNDEEAVDPATILKRMVYEHPVYTEESVVAQQRRKEISGIDRTFYCGAYWRNGFHEDGVVSALQALEEFAEVNSAQFALSRAS